MVRQDPLDLGSCGYYKDASKGKGKTPNYLCMTDDRRTKSIKFTGVKNERLAWYTCSLLISIFPIYYK